MDQETFPTLASTPDGSKVVVGQLDLSELESCLAPALNDPPAGFDPDDASRPDPAKPTTGPHRYTIYVPYDEKARVNIGAPHPDHGEPGIAMQTKTHFHVWTGQDGIGTALSLGAPATTTCYGTNRETFGYAMTTGGASNHIAGFQVTVASLFSGLSLGALQDVRIDSKLCTVSINGQSAVNVTSPGHVSIVAGSEIVPSRGYWELLESISRQLLSSSVTLLGQAVDGDMSAGLQTGKGLKNYLTDTAKKEAEQLVDYTLRKNAEAINKTLGHLKSIIGLVLAFKKTKKEVQEASGKFKKVKAGGSYVWSIASEVMSIVSDLTKSAKPKTPAEKVGDIDLTAHQNVNIAADVSVNISGFKGVAISAFKEASMSSLSCSIKAHKGSSIWGGMGADLKALAGDVSMQSDLKGATVKAKKDVKVTSEAGALTMGGNNDVQLTSVTADAYVHGNKGAYIGAGSGKGMGVVMKSAYMTLGKHANVHEYKKTVNEKDCGVIKIVDKSVKTTVTQSSSLELTDDKHEVKTDTVKVTATRNVEIKGKKVLLG